MLTTPNGLKFSALEPILILATLLRSSAVAANDPEDGDAAKGFCVADGAELPEWTTGGRPNLETGTDGANVAN